MAKFKDLKLESYQLEHQKYSFDPFISTVITFHLDFYDMGFNNYSGHVTCHTKFAIEVQDNKLCYLIDLVNSYFYFEKSTHKKINFTERYNPKLQFVEDFIIVEHIKSLLPSEEQMKQEVKSYIAQQLDLELQNIIARGNSLKKKKERLDIVYAG